MNCTIVISAYKRDLYLHKAITDCLSTTDCKIIVVASGAKEMWLHAALEYHDHERVNFIISGDKLTHSVGSNLGAELVDTDYICFLNDDIQLPNPGWLGGLLECLVRDLTIGVITPISLNPKNGPDKLSVYWCGKKDFTVPEKGELWHDFMDDLWSDAQLKLPPDGTVVDSFYANFCCAVTPTAVFKSIKLRLTGKDCNDLGNDYQYSTDLKAIHLKSAVLIDRTNYILHWNDNNY